MVFHGFIKKTAQNFRGLIDFKVNMNLVDDDGDRSDRTIVEENDYQLLVDISQEMQNPSGKKVQ